MASILKVDTIQDQSGNNIINESGDTITIGASGDTITIPSGATLSSTDPLVFPAGTASLPAITTTGDTNTGIFFPAADTIGFAEGGAEAMRITSDGNVGIGTTSPNISGFGSDFKVLSVKGSAADGGGVLELTAPSVTGVNRFGEIRFQNQAATSPFGFCGVRGVRDGADNSSAFVFFTSSSNSPAERMRITSTGSLILVGSTAQKATGTTWSNPSDTRLKDNKQNYTKGLNELLQINVKTWKWNGKAGTTQGDVGIGVIADEIETILPNTIDTYKAKLNEDDIEETDVKRFDATEITWLLLNSVKEQQAIIEELKARITTLENK